MEKTVRGSQEYQKAYDSYVAYEKKLMLAFRDYAVTGPIMGTTASLEIRARPLEKAKELVALSKEADAARKKFKDVFKNRFGIALEL